MNNVIIDDTPPGCVITVNGVEMKDVSAYSVERSVEDSIAVVTFSILCDVVDLRHTRPSKDRTPPPDPPGDIGGIHR